MIKEKGVMLHTAFLNETPCIDGNSFVYVKGNFIFKRNSIGEVDSMSIEKSKIFKSIDFMKLYQNQIWVIHTHFAIFYWRVYNFPFNNLGCG